MTTPIEVTVTYKSGRGPNVQCDITGPAPYVSNNAIFLPLNSGDFDISFRLDPGTSGLSWNERPFCADVGKCPRGPAPAPGQQQGQFRASAPNGEVITIRADGQTRRSVAHYRLDFDGGDSCDPIIINT